jgi:hypothetical protein
MWYRFALDDAVGAYVLCQRMERRDQRRRDARAFKLLCQRSAATRAGPSSRGEDHAVDVRLQQFGGHLFSVLFEAEE